MSTNFISVSLYPVLLFLEWNFLRINRVCLLCESGNFVDARILFDDKNIYLFELSERGEEREMKIK